MFDKGLCLGGRFSRFCLSACFRPDLRLANTSSQTQTYWKMYNAYEALSRAQGLSLLRVNMDETSIGLIQKPLERGGHAARQAREKQCAREDARVSKSPTH